ncbi:hypothetical protein GCM10009779_69030 [Polymorphospora rubra]|uniref:Uncharacterized protein n=1 Tax=Polymorphospora rubra TaxID=338584 RepID=A0A810NBT0_9ACTN|nr:hypothetical protein Prubr_58060 [Polymorphospora rubra]
MQRVEVGGAQFDGAHPGTGTERALRRPAARPGGVGAGEVPPERGYGDDDEGNRARDPRPPPEAPAGSAGGGASGRRAAGGGRHGT